MMSLPTKPATLPIKLVATAKNRNATLNKIASSTPQTTTTLQAIDEDTSAMSSSHIFTTVVAKNGKIAVNHYSKSAFLNLVVTANKGDRNGFFREVAKIFIIIDKIFPKLKKLLKFSKSSQPAFCSNVVTSDHSVVLRILRV